MDLRFTLGQLIERTESHTNQIEEIKSDVKAVRSLLEALQTRIMRSAVVGFWFILGAVLNWDPQKIAELISALKILK